VQNFKCVSLALPRLYAKGLVCITFSFTFIRWDDVESKF